MFDIKSLYSKNIRYPGILSAVNLLNCVILYFYLCVLVLLLRQKKSLKVMEFVIESVQTLRITVIRLLPVVVLLEVFDINFPDIHILVALAVNLKNGEETDFHSWGLEERSSEG